MRRLLPALIALSTAALVLAGALAAPTQQQDCAASPCTYVPIVYGPPPVSTATPTQLPSGVSILGNHTTHIDSIDVLHIVGEVVNNTTNTIAFVKISANLFNGAQLVKTDLTYAFLDRVRPGERTCFEVLVLNPPTYTSYTFEAPTYLVNTDALPVLTVLGDTHNIDTLGYYHILGQVRNDTGKQVKFVQPIATLYNGAGQAVDCDFTYVNSTDLAVGQTSAFDIGFIGRPLYTDVTSYHLQTDGNVQ
jgi:hypothetical protein